MIIQNNDTMVVVVKRVSFLNERFATNERMKSAVTRFRGRDFAFACNLSRFFTPPRPPPGLKSSSSSSSSLHFPRSCCSCCCFSFWSFSCTPFRLNFVSSSTRDAGVPFSGRFLRPRSSTTLRCQRPRRCRFRIDYSRWWGWCRRHAQKNRLGRSLFQGGATRTTRRACRAFWDDE